jgi:hypothetical protein
MPTVPSFYMPEIHPQEMIFGGAEDEEPESALEDHELEELYSGRFPANYEGDLISSKTSSRVEFERICTAFKQNKEE